MPSKILVNLTLPQLTFKVELGQIEILILLRLWPKYLLEIYVTKIFIIRVIRWSLKFNNQPDFVIVPWKLMKTIQLKVNLAL